MLYIPIPLSIPIPIPIPIPIYLYLYEALVWLTEVLVWLTQARVCKCRTPRLAAGMFCGLQVAGCRLKFNYNWKTAGAKNN